MRKLGAAYEHDQLLLFLSLIHLYFVENNNLTVDQVNRLEKSIINLLNYLMEVHEAI